MVDNMNPTSQFHPYQRETSVPVAERPEGGLNGLLNNVGIDPDVQADDATAVAKAIEILSQKIAGR